MTQPRIMIRTMGALALLLVVSSSASAQATRTWVSGVGDDVNPCSRTAPCKTFAGAISKTAPGGEIDAIDPGGFGAITITKAITIDGNGTFASILAAGTTGVTVNAGANDVVTIRNLSINGAGTGLHGIRFLGGKALRIENCQIFNFSQRGVEFVPAPAAAATFNLFINDTQIWNNNNAVNGGGIKITPGPNGTVVASLDTVKLERNLFGLLAEDRVTITVRNSVAAANTAQGFIAGGSTGPINFNIESCVTTGNGTFGVRNSNPNATAVIRLSNVTIMNNGTGVSTNGASIIRSFLNNRLDGNGTDGTLPITKAQQ